jgi:hypothetical protein
VLGADASAHRQLFSETLVAEDIDLGSRVHTLGYKCAHHRLWVWRMHVACACTVENSCIPILQHDHITRRFACENGLLPLHIHAMSVGGVVALQRASCIL